MANTEMEKTPCNCLWCNDCAKSEECLGEECDDYTPLDEHEVSDKEIEDRKYDFREEFFEYAEDRGMYD